MPIIPPGFVPPPLIGACPDNWTLPPSSSPHNRSFLSFDVTADELKTIKVNRHSASGVDGYHASIPFLMMRTEEGRSTLAKIFTIFIRKGEVPNEHKQGLWKALGKYMDSRRFDVAQQRPISLMSTFGKLFESIINKRLCSFLQRRGLISPEQFGFRERVGVLDHYLTLNNIVLHRASQRKKTWIAFVDVAKAFDQVNQRFLYYKMLKMGIDINIIHIVKSLLDTMLRSCVHGTTMSVWQVIKAGVSQGSVLGPILYSIFINDITAWFALRNHKLDVGLINKFINVLLFADDTTVFADSEEELQRICDDLVEYARRTWNWPGASTWAKHT